MTLLNFLINSKKLSAKYYPENKKRLQKDACERYENHSEEEKEKRTTTWSWTF